MVEQVNAVTANVLIPANYAVTWSFEVRADAGGRRLRVYRDWVREWGELSEVTNEKVLDKFITRKRDFGSHLWNAAFHKVETIYTVEVTSPSESFYVLSTSNHNHLTTVLRFLNDEEEELVEMRFRCVQSKVYG